MTRRFPIADLRALTALALEQGDYAPSDSGRIRTIPDIRTIRYYTTLGLIDRPAEMQGRTALYHERHVLQLAAIKRLQADNLTLSDIQQRLTGATDQQLETLAALPKDFWKSADRYLAENHTPTPDAKPPSAPQPPEDFWARAPALPDPPQPSALQELAGSGQLRYSYRIRVDLHRDAQLTVETTENAAGHPESIDLARIHVAAAPLLEELVRQGLLAAPHSLPAPSSPPEASS